MQKAAGLGLAAIILAAQPQVAFAVSLPGSTQVGLCAVLSWLQHAGGHLC